MQSPLGLLAVALRHRTWPRRGASILVRPAVSRPSRSLGRWFTAYSDCRSMAPAPASARPGRATHELQVQMHVHPCLQTYLPMLLQRVLRMQGCVGTLGQEVASSRPAASGWLAELRNGEP